MKEFRRNWIRPSLLYALQTYLLDSLIANVPAADAAQCTDLNVEWANLNPYYELTLGQDGWTYICFWCQSTNFSSSLLYQCAIKSVILDYNKNPIETSSLYTRNGESCVFGITNSNDWSTYRYSQYFQWGKSGSSGCSTRGVWAQNANAYEDFLFYIAYWDVNFSSLIFYQPVTVRLNSPCRPNTIVMSPGIPTQTVYVGAFLTLTNQYASTSFNTALSSTCPKWTIAQVQNSGTWLGSGDPNYRFLISQYVNTSGNTAQGVNIVLNPIDPNFYPGLSNTMQTIPIRITFKRYWEWFSTTSEFSVNVLPQSAIVKLCQSQTTTLITRSNLVSNKTYTVGVSSDLTITPPTFTVIAPTDYSYNNLNIPVQSIYTLLEYSLDNANWHDFPSVPSDATFFSTKNDASCVSFVDTSTWSFTVSCTDNTKFAANEQNLIIYFRFSAQWTKVEDQPTARVYYTNNMSSFTITLINGCKLDQITLQGIPVPSPLALQPLYSGQSFLITPGISFSHTISSFLCNNYHRRIVEVSTDGGLTWSSTYNTYSDLVSTPNYADLLYLKPPQHDPRLLLFAKPEAFDAGTIDYKRKIRVSVKSVYAVQPAQSFVYDVTIKPYSSIVLLAYSQIADTLKLTRAPKDFVYKLGSGEMTVPTIEFTQNPPKAPDNTLLRSPETIIRLYYSNDMGGTWIEVQGASTATWTSQTGDESCISWLDEVSKAIKLNCSEKMNYQFSGGLKSWLLKYTIGYKQMEAMVSTPNVIATTFRLTIKNEIVKLTYLAVTIPFPPSDQVIPITSPININKDKVYTFFDNKGEDYLAFDETTGSLVVHPEIRNGLHTATLTLPDQFALLSQVITYNITLTVQHTFAPADLKPINETNHNEPSDHESFQAFQAEEQSQVETKSESSSADSKNSDKRQGAKIWLESLSPYGLLKLRFDKPLQVPQNFQVINDTVLDVRIFEQTDRQKEYAQDRKLSSDETIEYINDFTWKVISFKEYSMELQLYFHEAYRIGTSYAVDVHILNKEHFTTKEAELAVDTDSLKLHATCKPQIQLGSPANLTKLVSSLSNEVTKVILLQTALALLLCSMRLSQLWCLINSLQIVAVLPFVSIAMPGNIHSLLKQLFSVVTFNVIDSSSLLVWLSRKLHLDLSPVNPRLEAMDITSSSQIVNFGFVFIVGVGLAYIYFFMGFARLVTTEYKGSKLGIYAPWVRRTNSRIMSTLDRHFYLRFFLETYMLQVLVQFIRLMGKQKTSWTNIFAVYFAVTNIMWLIAVPVITLWFLLKWRVILDFSFMRDKFGSVYEDVRIESRYALPYPVIFMAKRFLLVMFAVTPDGHGVAQSFLIINLLLISCCYDWAIKPLREPQMNLQEGILDGVALLISYSLVCYTDFLPSKYAQYSLGWVMYGVLVVVVLGSVGYTVGMIALTIKRRGRIYFRTLSQKFQKLRAWLSSHLVSQKPESLPLESDSNLFIKRDTHSKIELGDEQLESFEDPESSQQKSLEVKELEIIDEEGEESEQSYDEEEEVKVVELEKYHEIEVVMKRPVTCLSLELEENHNFNKTDFSFNQRPTAPPTKPASPIAAAVTLQIESLEPEGPLEIELSEADKWFLKHGHKPTTVQVSLASKIKGIVLQTEVLQRIARREIINTRKKPLFRVKKAPAPPQSHIYD